MLLIYTYYVRTCNLRTHTYCSVRLYVVLRSKRAQNPLFLRPPPAPCSDCDANLFFLAEILALSTSEESGPEGGKEEEEEGSLDEMGEESSSFCLGLFLAHPTPPQEGGRELLCAPKEKALQSAGSGFGKLRRQKLSPYLDEDKPLPTRLIPRLSLSLRVPSFLCSQI